MNKPVIFKNNEARLVNDVGSLKKGAIVTILDRFSSGNGWLYKIETIDRERIVVKHEDLLPLSQYEQLTRKIVKSEDKGKRDWESLEQEIYDLYSLIRS